VSNYRCLTTHPHTGRAVMADWLDDYWGKHKYGVRFDGDAHVFDADWWRIRRAADTGGVKDDNTKAPWHLLPTEPIAEVVDILGLGAVKYAPDNWRRVPDGIDRYYAAAMRHIAAWRMGEQADSESGKSHLAHAMCCLIFIYELERQDGAEEAA
jgi:hypothetical protein